MPGYRRWHVSERIMDIHGYWSATIMVESFFADESPLD